MTSAKRPGQTGERPDPTQPPRGPTPRLGAQVSTSGGLLQTLARGQAIGAEVIQIFPSNPRRWSPAAFAPTEIAAFRDALGDVGCGLFVHTIYLINLASPDAELRQKAVGALTDALRFAARAGAEGVVTHVGSHRGDGFEAALPRVREGVEAAQAAALAAIDLPSGSSTLPPLLLESSAGSGDSVGRDPRELCLLLERLAGSPGPCALCLDTAHLFAAGFAVHTPEGLEEVLRQLRSGGYLDAVGLVHLNDCRSTFGSRADRHENLGDGLLGLEGLAVSLRHPDLARVPFVLEVPGLEGKGPDRENMERARRLLAAAADDPLGSGRSLAGC